MMDGILEVLDAHWATMTSMLFGISVHIAKKAAQRRMQDETFSLKDYVLRYPYQTYASMGMGIGAYLQLVSDPSTPLTLFAAFLAGIAVNSFADLAPGDRNK